MKMMEEVKGFKLNEKTGYFQNKGVNVMAFDDIYPEGHQSGVSIIMHGHRVATNGDLRFEQTPGQWQPVPKQNERKLNLETHSITTNLSFPDQERHLKGFNPMIYPDFKFNYEVKVVADGDAVIVTVDLSEPVPERFAGKLCFNLELFPGDLFGKPWIMDDQTGIFPQQPNGPTLELSPNYHHTLTAPSEGILTDLKTFTGDLNGYNPAIADDMIAEPYAMGHQFTVRPDDEHRRFTIESLDVELKLYDGRMNHNNGWFVVSSELPTGETKQALTWKIKPHIVADWIYAPVVQVSQVGYHPEQPKIAIIELDSLETKFEQAVLSKITTDGPVTIRESQATEWGLFLRYNYLHFDFSDVREEGLYKITYGDSESAIFRIATDIYERGVWQPVLEYFLPVQMCHMRVNEKYRVWHGYCHHDDARMAPTNYNHFDGYVQGPSTLCDFAPGDLVPGVNEGGWHDAGDFDLRIESQAGEVYILTLAYEAFDVNYDVTTIDQKNKVVEIHQPDGKNDILQQIEHGLLSIMGAYRTLGRLYRGIICNDLRQYVLLGDSAAMTNAQHGDDDDRWIFTEDNPPRELTTAAQLAAAARALRGFNDELSTETLNAAKALYEITDATDARSPKIHAAVELFLTTNEAEYKAHLLAEIDYIVTEMTALGWIVAKAEQALADEQFSEKFKAALPELKASYEQLSAETPYGVPYRPQIWGAGWDIQRQGSQYYFLHRAYPDIFEPDLIYNALNFILGAHPGTNTMSFASGVGATSATVGYGLNRADWSYIPGGVISGTALIRPDFPELLVFPYLWQQVEYVLGGGSSHYMFLVLAAKQLLDEQNES